METNDLLQVLRTLSSSTTDRETDTGFHCNQILMKTTFDQIFAYHSIHALDKVLFNSVASEIDSVRYLDSHTGLEVPWHELKSFFQDRVQLSSWAVQHCLQCIIKNNADFGCLSPTIWNLIMRLGDREKPNLKGIISHVPRVIFVPLFVNSDRWALVIFCIYSKQVLFCDPLNGNLRADQEQNVRALFKLLCFGKELSCETIAVNVPQQLDSHSSGLLVLEMAEIFQRHESVASLRDLKVSEEFLYWFKCYCLLKSLNGSKKMEPLEL